MMGTAFRAVPSLPRFLLEFFLRFKAQSVAAFLYAGLAGLVQTVSLADPSPSGWLYVQDPRIELRVWPVSEGHQYELKIFESSPGVPDEFLDRFSGVLERDSENHWADRETLVLQGNPGDRTLEIKLHAQGSKNWSARMRNYYPGKQWDTLTLAPTGVLPGIGGIYENTGESGPNFDEYLTLQEIPGGVLFSLEFVMAGEELLNQFAPQVSKHRFLFKRSASDSAGKGELEELEINVGNFSDNHVPGMEPIAHHAILTTRNSDALSFPWNQIRDRSYQKLASGGTSTRAFRLHSKPMSPTLAQGLEKIERADALLAADRAGAATLYLEASAQLGGGAGLAEALEDRRSNWRALRTAIRNAWTGVDFSLETLWRELGWSQGDLYIDPAFIFRAHAAAGVDAKERYPEQWELMQIALESGDLDLNAFLRDQRLKKEDLRASPYAIWELAQEASKGGRFGGPNAKLALQLVLRGGGNVKEREAAIRQCHAILKGTRSGPFDLAECIHSRVGKAYLLSRTAPPCIPAVEGAASLSEKLGGNALRALFAAAFESAQTFAEAESQHYAGCRGFFTWESNRAGYEDSVLRGFVNEMNSVVSGKLPELIAGDDDPETTLEELIKEAHIFMRGPLKGVIRDVQDPALDDCFYFAEGEGAVLHKTWKSYRDAAARFLHALKPERTEEEWKRWMNNRRMKFLQYFKNLSLESDR